MLSCFRYNVHLREWYFSLKADATPDRWTHITFVYVGPDGGITVYHDGVLKGGTKRKIYYEPDTYYGELKIGKLFEDDNHRRFGKVMVDELTLWNRQLSLEEIMKIKNID